MCLMPPVAALTQPLCGGVAYAAEEDCQRRFAERKVVRDGQRPKAYNGCVGGPMVRAGSLATLAELRNQGGGASACSGHGGCRRSRRLPGPEPGRSLFRIVAEQWFETTEQRTPKTRAGYRHILCTATDIEVVVLPTRGHGKRSA
jgi:hypothetical protein